MPKRYERHLALISLAGIRLRRRQARTTLRPFEPSRLRPELAGENNTRGVNMKSCRAQGLRSPGIAGMDGRILRYGEKINAVVVGSRRLDDGRIATSRQGFPDEGLQGPHLLWADGKGNNLTRPESRGGGVAEPGRQNDADPGPECCQQYGRAVVFGKQVVLICESKK
jgi:hypothetical protein